VSRRSLKQIVGIAVFAATAAYPQTAAPESSSASTIRPQGIHLYDVALYQSYYSSLLFGDASSGYDLSAGASVSLGWTRVRPRSSLFLSYTSSYTRDFTHSALNALNHNFSLTFGHKLSAWNFTGGVAASVMNTDQFLFEPDLFVRVTEAASTVDELAAALLRNTNFDNTYLAALLTGAPVLESPARSVFFGDRILNAAFQAALTRSDNGSRSLFQEAACAFRIFREPGTRPGSFHLWCLLPISGKPE